MQETQQRPVQVQMLPFGTMHMSVVIPPIPQPEPRQEGEGDRIKLVEATTAVTRIISLPAY